MSITLRNLSQGPSASTNLTPQQNKNILIAGLTCATFSVLATLVTLRWFILMKRTFRHKLIMFLILSDTFKALWYFIYPIVLFTRGPIQSSDPFCQANGFFLSLGIEASDFAIFMIAIHSILYIFHPPATAGEVGGLYRWRYYIYPAWIALPLLLASLAFINQENGYVTAGTYCYLPRRPYWYRLALSWIPRYFILILIFTMYATLYIYVTLRFRSFGNMMRSDSESSTRSDSRRSSMSLDGLAPDELPPPAPTPAPLETPKKHRFSRPGYSRSGSHTLETPPRQLDPWDEVSFITTRALRNSGTDMPSSIQSSDFVTAPQDAFSSFSFQPRAELSTPDTSKSQAASNCLTVDTIQTATTLLPSLRKPSKPSSPPVDTLDRTRRAIRKQLRYLFIYPAVYVLMWVFPFVAHCLLYQDYYVRNPIYWLITLATCSVSLQAGMDCIVFSWREKPWRRIPADRRWTFSDMTHRLSAIASAKSSARPSVVDEDTSTASAPNPKPATVKSPLWWEAEGKMRKDSVWMGTDRRDTVLEPTTSPIAEADESAFDLQRLESQRRRN